MLLREFVSSTVVEAITSKPCIVVDVQPAYGSYADQVAGKIMKFLNQQTGLILMFMNAEETGTTDDTEDDVAFYWEENGFDPNNWQRVIPVDKGYSYFRSWMDNGISEATIIKVIRALYQAKVTSSWDLELNQLKQLVGTEWQEWMKDDPIIVKWTSVARLKRFNGAYIMGGSRAQCLREVELLMNAFNIKYKRIDSLVYG